jgi:hypothetical protein
MSCCFVVLQPHCGNFDFWNHNLQAPHASNTPLAGVGWCKHESLDDQAGPQKLLYIFVWKIADLRPQKSKIFVQK